MRTHIDMSPHRMAEECVSVRNRKNSTTRTTVPYTITCVRTPSMPPKMKKNYIFLAVMGLFFNLAVCVYTLRVSLAAGLRYQLCGAKH